MPCFGDLVRWLLVSDYPFLAEGGPSRDQVQNSRKHESCPGGGPEAEVGVAHVKNVIDSSDETEEAEICRYIMKRGNQK